MGVRNGIFCVDSEMEYVAREWINFTDKLYWWQSLTGGILRSIIYKITGKIFWKSMIE